MITVIEVIAEMGIEPTYELASQVDKLMQESYAARAGHPPFKENFITVQKVINDMGREPTEELVSWVEERMAEWYEVHRGHAPTEWREAERREETNNLPMKAEISEKPKEQ